MEKRSLFARGSLEVTLSNEAPEDAISLLEKTVWGTPGGTLYRHLDTSRRIHLQQSPAFMVLRKSERMLGILGFSRRTLQQPAGPTEAFYIRYLSMVSGLHRQTEVGSTGKTRSDGLLKKLVDRSMAKPVNMNPVEGQGPASALYYAYVELENERSMEMCKSLKFSPVGKFSTVLFSRFFPKRHDAVDRLRPEEQEAMRARIRDFYKDHAMFTDGNLFFENNYFVRREGGRIVAGLQANPCHWVVEHMPGFTGNLIVKVLPKFPLLKRVFNPGEFRFAGIEGIWYAPGYESAVFDVMESALTYLGLYTAVLWLDRRSPVDSVIRGGSLGLLQSLNDDSPADIIVRSEGVDDHIIEDIRSRPLYISSFDST